MISDASDYKWSSYNKRVKGTPDTVVDLDPRYKALGSKAEGRRIAYGEYVMQTIPEEELKLIRDAVQRNQLTGGDRFRKQIERKHCIRLSNHGPGRPSKTNSRVDWLLR